MDIVEFLKEEHRVIRNDMRRVGSALISGYPGAEVRMEFRDLVARLQLHEEIEQQLFSSLDDQARKADEENPWTSELRKAHEAVWTFLDLTLDAMDSESPEFIRRAFFKFEARMRAHLEREEKVLFPWLRRLPESRLEGLGAKARKALLGAKLRAYGSPRPRFVPRVI